MNTCGVQRVDHLRIVNLIEAVYAFCQVSLKPGGAMVAKVFLGGTEASLLAELKNNFAKITHFKPNSSRKSSPETYLIATGYMVKE
jgi:23S rRNA (uridine2552-2'-O)-methyltransferase